MWRLIRDEFKQNLRKLNEFIFSPCNDRDVNKFLVINDWLYCFSSPCTECSGSYCIEWRRNKMYYFSIIHIFVLCLYFGSCFQSKTGSKRLFSGRILHLLHPLISTKCTLLWWLLITEQYNQVVCLHVCPVQLLRRVQPYCRASYNDFYIWYC